MGIMDEETVFGSCPCIMMTCNLKEPTICMKEDMKCIICDGGFCCAAGADKYPIGCIDSDKNIAKKKLSLFCMELGLIMPDPKQLCFCSCACLICKYVCDCPTGKGPCALVFYSITPEKGIGKPPPADVMQRV